MLIYLSFVFFILRICSIVLLHTLPSSDAILLHLLLLSALGYKSSILWWNCAVSVAAAREHRVESNALFNSAWSIIKCSA